MAGFQPRLEVSVDEATGTIRAAYVRVREGQVCETREVENGSVFADYDQNGVLLGFELLG